MCLFYTNYVSVPRGVLCNMEAQGGLFIRSQETLHFNGGNLHGWKIICTAKHKQSISLSRQFPLLLRLCTYSLRRTDDYLNTAVIARGDFSQFELIDCWNPSCCVTRSSDVCERLIALQRCRRTVLMSTRPANTHRAQLLAILAIKPLNAAQSATVGSADGAFPGCRRARRR